MRVHTRPCARPRCGVFCQCVWYNTGRPKDAVSRLPTTLDEPNQKRRVLSHTLRPGSWTHIHTHNRDFMHDQTWDHLIHLFVPLLLQCSQRLSWCCRRKLNLRRLGLVLYTVCCTLCEGGRRRLVTSIIHAIIKRATIRYCYRTISSSKLARKSSTGRFERKVLPSHRDRVSGMSERSKKSDGGGSSSSVLPLLLTRHRNRT